MPESFSPKQTNQKQPIHTPSDSLRSSRIDDLLSEVKQQGVILGDSCKALDTLGILSATMFSRRMPESPKIFSSNRQREQ